jgi:hypothetical protein
MRRTKPRRPRERPDSGLAHLVDLKVEALKTIVTTSVGVCSTRPSPRSEQGNRRAT